MMKKVIYTGAAIGTSMLLLTGCGSGMPKLTEAEMELVGEYAAGMLLKYDVNHRSRLVELEQEEPETQETESEVPEEVQDSQSETQAGNVPEDTTPIVDNTDAQISIEKQLALPEDVTVTYQGMKVLGSYPEQGEEEIYFALDASTGKKLLVMQFSLSNASQTDAVIDISSQKQRFRITVNGSTSRNALSTMLLEDLTQYVGTIPAGQSVNTVIIAEVDEETAANVTSLSMTVKNDASTTTMSLQ